MQPEITTLTAKKTSVLATNKVLRNTYFLLSLTLVFSAITAILSMASNAQPGAIISIIGMFGLLFLTQALRNSVWGIFSAFAFTGFMGYVLGPTLNFYIHNFSNGGQLIITALGGTGAIFLALSAYTLMTRKNFSYMGGFLSAAIMVAFIASLAGLFFHMPLFQLFISGIFMLICSALIMYYTSAIIHGGETNYIMATISIYVALLNIFMGLLNILGAFAGNRN
ncbi:MAG: Bax inhibitor-1/YccA family protein [Gammaproteobacteria bacterium]|nr:Bax inhibitor-1/YccA family protein [Gammaproteobacteria bacterium]